MNNGENTSYWRKRVLKHWDLINRLAARRFSEANMADEAALFALEALKSDDWRRVKSYQGRSRFTTFLTVIVNRLLEDYSRSRFGRLRAPKWVKDGGPLWLHVYRLLCEERYGFDEAVELTVVSGPGGRDEGKVIECAETILAKISDCGKRRMEPALVDPHILETDQLSNEAPGGFDPEEVAASRQTALLLGAIGDMLKPKDGPEDVPAGDDDNLSLFIQTIRSAVQISPEERLFLKSIYHDGMTVVGAGRLYDWGTDESHRKLRGILKRLRQAFEAKGLDMELKRLLKTDAPLEI